MADFFSRELGQFDQSLGNLGNAIDRQQDLYNQLQIEKSKTITQNAIFQKMHDLGQMNPDQVVAFQQGNDPNNSYAAWARQLKQDSAAFVHGDYQQQAAQAITDQMIADSNPSFQKIFDGKLSEHNINEGVGMAQLLIKNGQKSDAINMISSKVQQGLWTPEQASQIFSNSVHQSDLGIVKQYAIQTGSTAIMDGIYPQEPKEPDSSAPPEDQMAYKQAYTNYSNIMGAVQRLSPADLKSLQTDADHAIAQKQAVVKQQTEQFTSQYLGNFWNTALIGKDFTGGYQQYQKAVQSGLFTGEQLHVMATTLEALTKPDNSAKNAAIKAQSNFILSNAIDLYHQGKNSSQIEKDPKIEPVMEQLRQSDPASWIQVNSDLQKLSPDPYTQFAQTKLDQIKFSDPVAELKAKSMLNQIIANSTGPFSLGIDNEKNKQAAITDLFNKVDADKSLKYFTDLTSQSDSKAFANDLVYGNRATDPLVKQQEVKTNWRYQKALESLPYPPDMNDPKAPDTAAIQLLGTQSWFAPFKDSLGKQGINVDNMKYSPYVKGYTINVPAGSPFGLKTNQGWVMAIQPRVVDGKVQMFIDYPDKNGGGTGFKDISPLLNQYIIFPSTNNALKNFNPFGSK